MLTIETLQPEDERMIRNALKELVYKYINI